MFAVDKEIEKTTQQSQLHSTGSELWQYLSLTSLHSMAVLSGILLSGEAIKKGARLNEWQK